MKLKYFIYICLFFNLQFLFAQSVLSNEIKIILNSKQTDKEKLINIQNLLNKQKKNIYTSDIGIAYNELGLLQYKNQLKNEAINSFKKSIQILKAYKKSNLNDLNRARNNLAWLYKYEGWIDKEYATLNEIINDRGNDQYTFDAQVNISLIDSDRGDYFLGIKKLNLLLSNSNNLENSLVARIKIIQIFAMLAEIDSDKNIVKNISSIKAHQDYIQKNFAKSQLEETKLYEFYNNLANIYESIGDYNSALQFYTKSKIYFKKQNNEYDHYFVLNNIGYLFGKQNKIDLASNCFKEIINCATDVNQIATAYDNLAYFSKQKAIDKIPYYEKAIQIILEQGETSFKLPSIETIIDSGYQQEVMVYLVDLASNYVATYKSTTNKSYLFKAKEALYLIDELVSIIRYESTTERSKLFWIEKGVNTYLLGAEVCYLLNKPQEGFYFMEKNKALLLQENIKTYQAKLELKVPQEIRDKEYMLHYEWIIAEKKHQQFPNKPSIKANYIKKHKEFENFITTLRNKYPEYVRSKQKIDIVSLSKVVNSLNGNECFVTYILNDDKGYGLFADKSNTHFFEIQHITNLQQNIETLKKYNTQFTFDKQERTQFQQISTKVFKSLFPFPNALTSLENKKLTIIADGFLLNLPFEALCVNNSSGLKDSYFINFSEISYLQSFSAFEKIKQWKNNATKKLLLTVPYQFSDKSLPTLTRSKDVIEQLEKYSSSMILFDKEATKEGFKEAVKEHKILHLNTHAGVDTKTQTPWIAFSNAKMTLDELYGIPNQAELVILDACKTNEGQILSGEGIFSLSRGFFMNGAKSVLSSLWNVNEKAGNEIITSFYTELENGYTKSKALQLAKIKYLREHQLLEVLPYHWASFVLTGSNDAIEINQKWYYNSAILVVLGLIVIISIVYLIMNKKKKV
ncbi:MAG: CHAT domain-containing protein [Limnohabitans sp.]|nr:CHAT domain-containing protein [Limnohabitans sp.]